MAKLCCVSAIRAGGAGEGGRYGRGGVGEDDGGARGAEGVDHGVFRGVREVDEHAKAVHLAYHGLARGAEAVPEGRGGDRAVGVLRVAIMAECGIAHSEAVEEAEGGGGVADHV